MSGKKKKQRKYTQNCCDQNNSAAVNVRFFSFSLLLLHYGHLRRLHRMVHFSPVLVIASPFNFEKSSILDTSLDWRKKKNLISDVQILECQNLRSLDTVTVKFLPVEKSFDRKCSWDLICINIDNMKTAKWICHNISIFTIQSKW